MYPKVTVIVPIYGVEKYIERCARSLFEQTLNDIEFIFVDDCTPDQSMNILNGVIENKCSCFAMKGWTVRIERMPSNSGLPAVRKYGIGIATGQYIFHCDSDDWIDSNLLSQMYDKAAICNLDVVICDFMRTDGFKNSAISGGRILKRDECISEMMHRKMWWSLCNKLFRRDLYKNVVFPTGAMGEDMCLCLQLMSKVTKIDYVHGSYYYYYINPNSIIMSNSKEKVLSKFSQLSDNIGIVKDFYSRAGVSDVRIKKGFLYLNYYRYESLQTLLYDQDVKKLWKEGIKKTTWEVVKNKYAVLKYRVKALLLHLGFEPIS